MKKAIIAAATAALVIAGAIVGAAPASAVDGAIVIKIDGEWKAYLVYTSDDNRLCARAYNSTKEAWAQAEIHIDGRYVQFVQDDGGDQERSCMHISGVEGETATLDGVFVDSMRRAHYATYSMQVTI